MSLRLGFWSWVCVSCFGLLFSLLHHFENLYVFIWFGARLTNRGVLRSFRETIVFQSSCRSDFNLSKFNTAWIVHSFGYVFVIFLQVQLYCFDGVPLQRWPNFANWWTSRGLLEYWWIQINWKVKRLLYFIKCLNIFWNIIYHCWSTICFLRLFCLNFTPFCIFLFQSLNLMSV